MPDTERIIASQSYLRDHNYYDMKQLLVFAMMIAFSVSMTAQDLSSLGIANDDVPTGLQEGTIAPDFTGTSSNGETFILSKALRHNAVALVFYRGYWCGYCSRALEEYSDALEQLAEDGIEVVAVTPETYTYIEHTVDEADVRFTVLSDPDGEIMRAYDVDFRVTDGYQQKIENSKGKTLNEINDQEVAELPIPATYLIVRDGKEDHGVVVWRHFDPNYRKRASVEEIREALRSLN